MPDIEELVEGVRLLLNTHVAPRWLNDPGRLDEPEREAIADGANEVAVSAASVWEVAITTVTGGLGIPAPFVAGLRRARLDELPITWAHTQRVSLCRSTVATRSTGSWLRTRWRTGTCSSLAIRRSARARCPRSRRSRVAARAPQGPA